MFETRFFERLADEQELENLHKRHTDVLDTIDVTADEAKEVASDFRAQLKAFHEQEQNLRRNLKSGTIPVEVEAKSVANVDTGLMEYFDREGNLIPQLTHELSKADREQDALRKQLDMFGNPQKLADNIQSEMQKQFGDDVTVSVNGVQATGSDASHSAMFSSEGVANEFPADELPDLMIAKGEFELDETTATYKRVDILPVSLVDTDLINAKGDNSTVVISNYEIDRNETGSDIGALSDLSTLSEVPSPDDREAEENPHGLPFDFADDKKPDIRDGINGAIAILTGTDKPLPKNSKKRKSEPKTV